MWRSFQAFCDSTTSSVCCFFSWLCLNYFSKTFPGSNTILTMWNLVELELKLQPLRIATLLKVSCPASTLKFLVTNSSSSWWSHMGGSINPFWALEWDWFVCCHSEVERLFTYLLCSLMVSVNEQHKAILRTGFEVSTLSAADCSVFPGSKFFFFLKVVQQQFILIYFLFQSGSWKKL